jgi:hypothetical protein
MAAPVSLRVLDDNWNQKVCVVAATPVDAGLQQGPGALCNAGRLTPDAPDAADAASADGPDGG